MQHVPPDTHLTRAEAWTLGLTYFTVAITVSLVHSTAGTEAWVIIGATLMVNSATATLAYAAVTASGGSTLAGIASGWLVTTRFGLMAAAIAPRMWPSMWRRALGAFTAFDPTVTLAMRETDNIAARRVYISVSMWLVFPWWAGSLVGIAVGEQLGDTQRLGLDAMFPALFIAIIWPQMKSRTGVSIGLMGAVIALALVEPTPGGLPVLLAALAALLALKDVR